MNILLRRKKLGLGSCNGIVAVMEQAASVVRHDKGVPEPNGANEYCFRWGCTANVSKGYKVINKAEGIHLVCDKTRFRKILDEHSLCTPSFYTKQAIKDAQGIEEGVIVRPRKHAQGRNLFHCKTPEQLNNAIAKCGDGWYANKFVTKVSEYRVFVAQGRAVWVAQKTPANPDEIAWNVANGGRFDNVRWSDWPLKAVKTAIEAHSLSGLDFSGVDIMVDDESSVWVLEINSAPSQTSPYRQSCVAKVFDYIVQGEVPEAINKEKRGAWKKFIHPALSEEAWN